MIASSGSQTVAMMAVMTHIQTERIRCTEKTS
jgi:hypothetical protein